MLSEGFPTVMMMGYYRSFVILALWFLMKSFKFCQIRPESTSGLIFNIALHWLLSVSLTATMKEWNFLKLYQSVFFHVIHFFLFWEGGSSNNSRNISSLRKKKITVTLQDFCWTTNLKNTYFNELKNHAWIMQWFWNDGLTPEAVAQRCSVKQLFLEVSQNSQEITCARDSFLIKL